MFEEQKTLPLINFSQVFGIIGFFLLFLAGVFLVLGLLSLVWMETLRYHYLILSIVTLGIGWVLFRRFEKRQDLQLREVFLIVTLTWFCISLLGALPFYTSGVVSTYTDAFFETMSGLTTTGATIFGGTTTTGFQNPDIESLPNTLLLWRSTLHWFGGMGFIVLSIAILPMLGSGGMHLFQAESSLLGTDKLMPRFQQTAKLLWFVYVGITFLHFLSLWIHPSMDWFHALNHAFSTLATGGFSTLNTSVGGFNSVYIDVVITFFMFLAGVNFILHFRLLTGRYSIVVRNRELRFYTIVAVLMILGISLSLWLTQNHTFGEAFRYGSFQALSILTTTGYGTDDYTLWPILPLFLLFILFFAGGSTGSTSGGIKMTRWMIVLRVMGSEIRQAVHPRAVIPVRVGDHILTDRAVRTVMSFFAIYLLLFAFGSFVMTLLGFDLLSAISASIACIANIGPAFGEFGPAENYAAIPSIGKWLLALFMLIGRLEVLAVVVLFSRDFWSHYNKP
ncbi:MAG: TrkH family potassium uptake protein [Cyclonatronaceae bacterium]